MRVGAVAKDIGIPSRKVRLVVDMVRGKKVEDAINILKFTHTAAAKVVAKVIQSASANAENNFQLDPADLKVVYIVADEGHTLKRYRPQSRGRFSPILKRATHIKVFVSEEGK
ncbi:MAG: 50S ribosomal protein L22 [Dehalococcoidia bacterium]|nr:MAG: 50S ribosomal protein L22 [Dehalococcoidia bacterium]